MLGLKNTYLTKQKDNLRSEEYTNIGKKKSWKSPTGTAPKQMEKQQEVSFRPRLIYIYL
jgi:hypothetical protein